MSRPRIICAGMCNTKSAEIRYLAQQVAEYGGEPIIMDLSLGAAVDWADISLEDVLASTGVQVEDVFAAPRATAIELVGHAGAVKILELHAKGEVDGIISWAGSVGTTTATRVMRALPFGVPKIMLTDMASGDVSLWLGNKDIYMVNPTAEQGINVVTRKAVANAAAGIVAMARVSEIPAGSRPLAAITSYGTTTPTVLRCAAFMEGRGWDIRHVPCGGCSWHHYGGPHPVRDDHRDHRPYARRTHQQPDQQRVRDAQDLGWKRLMAAGDVGIPQIVVPGGLDQVVVGALDTVPQEYLDDVRSERRMSYKGSGLPYSHNPSVTIMVPTPSEVEQVSRSIAERLNRTTGPTALFLPMRGWSAYDQNEALATRARGWAEGNGDGPTWQPDPDRPSWSSKATLMLSVLEAHLDHHNENLDLIVCDRHILDPEFADLLTRCMGGMLDHTWRKGLYRDVDGVIG